jgi:hypothetical protein
MRTVFSFSLVKFIPDQVRGEHVNLGIVLKSRDGEVLVEMPDSLRNSKVERWWPDVDLVLLQSYVAALQRKLPAALESRPLEEVVSQFSNGMIILSPPELGISLEPLSDYLVELKRRFVDLRFKGSGRTPRTASFIRRNIISRFKTKGFLGTRVEVDPEPVRPSFLDLPARSDFRWLNGSQQYIKVFSADQSEEASGKKADELWDFSKALLKDCDTIQATKGVLSVVLQHAESPNLGTFLEIGQVLNELLKQRGIAVYEARNINPLLDKIATQSRILPQTLN